MNRYKWIRWIVLVGVIAFLAAGCSKRETPAIDPPQLGYEMNEDEISQTVSLIHSELEETVSVSLFLQDLHGYVVPISIQVPNEPGIAKLALKYMIANGPFANQLPEGFTALIPEGTEVIGMEILQDEKLAIVDFSKHFANYEAKDERKILEAITWSLTEFPTIDQVKIWVDGKLLKQMPVAGIPLDEPLTRAMGINIEQDEGVNLGRSTPVTLYFQNQTHDLQTYFVPVTRLIEQTDNVALAAIEQLIKGPMVKTNLASTMPTNIDVLDLQQADDLISVYLTNMIFDTNLKVPTESLQAVILSLTENTDAAKVKIMVDSHTEVKSTDDTNYSQPVLRPTRLNMLAM